MVVRDKLKNHLGESTHATPQTTYTYGCLNEYFPLHPFGIYARLSGQKFVTKRCFFSLKGTTGFGRWLTFVIRFCFLYISLIELRPIIRSTRTRRRSLSCINVHYALFAGATQIYYTTHVYTVIYRMIVYECSLYF